MSLRQVCSRDAYDANIAELIRAGHTREQAVAIARRVLRKACGGDPQFLAIAAQEAGPLPEEALRYFRAKGLRPGFSYLDVWREEHAAAFTVAKIMEQDVLADVRSSIDQALASGVPFHEWSRDIKGVLDRSGWSSYVAERDRPRRLRTIYQTNMRVARAVGQWERIQRTKRALPYLLYQLGPSERHRPEHERWNNLILPVDDPFWDAHMPPNGWGCFLPNQLLSGNFVGGSKAFYSGPAVEIQLESGVRLAVTVNHPVATTEGWVAAGDIQPDQSCLSHRPEVEFVRFSRTPHASAWTVADQQAPSRVENVFDALSAHRRASAQVTSLDFHGDALRFIGEVNVVGSYVHLAVERRTQEFCETLLSRPSTAHITPDPLRHLDAFDQRMFPTRRFVRTGAKSLAFGGRKLTHSHVCSVGRSAELDAMPSKEIGQSASTHAEFIRQLQDRSAGRIAPDRVVGVRRFPFRGHVYDFESTSGWLLAQGVVASNCKCHVIPLSRGQVDRRGGESERPPEQFYDWRNPKTGNLESIPVGIDPGWNYNPGRERLRKLAQEAGG